MIPAIRIEEDKPTGDDEELLKDSNDDGSNEASNDAPPMS